MFPSIRHLPANRGLNAADAAIPARSQEREKPIAVLAL
jgi:hypothetical protein